MSDTNTKGTGVDEVVHAYDDIQEYDNALPNWWLVTFYGAILFSAVYWFAYHSFGKAEHPRTVFDKEMAEYNKQKAAAASKVISADELLALSKDDKAMQQARTTWTTNCVACHKDDGSGLVGPNLTDNKWIHGGKPDQIYKTVANGAPNGMAAWLPILGEEKTKGVAAYVLTFKGKNLPGKPPEANAKEEN